MIINETQFNVELKDILIELISQLRANNIELIRKYKEGPTHIQICCPYHANGLEHRPSAGIRKSDGLFHCFACNEVHTLPEVISYCFDRKDDIIGSFGWQWLLKNFATVQVEERKDVALDFYRNSKRTNDNNSTNYKFCSTGYVDKLCGKRQSSQQFVSEEELDKYRYTHPYMYKRGLTDEIIELFDIGFDRDTQCITFPVRDINGNCLFVARRSVKTKFFNYPQGVEKPLYGLYEFSEALRVSKLERNFIYYGLDFTDWCCDTMIVCESMLDALSFWTVGKYAVALNGLGNELQFKQLRELPCRKLILATDMDERGLAARKRIKQNMKNTKIITEYLFPKGRKDANECTKEELKNLRETF